MAFPALREDIDLHPGARMADGQPTWTLHDPARNRFYRIDWQTFAILSHWHLDDPVSVCRAVSAESTLRPDPEDVEHVAMFLSENELLQPAQGDSARRMAARLRLLRGSWARRLLHNYLFFRIPLVNPDAFLDRLARWAEPLYSKGFAQATAAALVAGLFLVYREWTQFSTSLVDTMSWRGLAAYGAALALVKVVHEFGHAVTAKRFGCRVPTMGVAFLVLWPVAYTDTNEVWKLADHRRRLAVASAGVAIETIIAIWATLAWTLLPDGTLKSVAFVLATLTWVTTVTINASPFLRFDGYFVLSDWLDMPNLHSRAFAMARWDLRERLFALALPPPEYFPRRQAAALILFAWVTWLYRLVVFVGIAVLVYHFFIKLAGIFLFGIEVGWFIAMPVLNEVQAWRKLWPLIRKGSAARKALLIIACVSILLVPLPTRLSVSGQLKVAESFTVFAPMGAQVADLPWREGSSVSQGARLIDLASPDLTLRWQLANIRLERLRQQASTAGVDSAQQQNMGPLNESVLAAEAELASVETEVGRYRPVAPFTGTLRDLDPELRVGTWVHRQERLMTLVPIRGWQVEAYVDEDALRRIESGQYARFYPDGAEGPTVALTVASIDEDATRVLANGMLATVHGGSVLTREKDHQLVPERAVYRITLQAAEPPASFEGHSWRGRVVIHAGWEAPAAAFFGSVVSVLWRELSF